MSGKQVNRTTIVGTYNQAQMFLQVSQLDVRYPGRAHAAVQGVSLALPAGDIGVLIGPSGCGKTTLLRAVAGLEPVSAGEIHLSRRMVSNRTHCEPPETRRVGMVFQDYALFPHLTVAQNVGFGLHTWARAQRQQRVVEVLALVGLEHSAQQYPHALSGGQQQRVALARALAPQPDLLLLDEPFSNLDVDLRERLAHEVRQILKAAKATALFVTHDQLEAFAIGDHIGVMHEGQLHQWASAYTLYHEPATRFVAGFIGHGVFAPARLSRPSGHVQLDTPLGLLHPTHLAAHLPEGDYDLLLRADDLVHLDDAPVQAEVMRKAFRGSEFLYTLRLRSGETVLAQVPSHHDHHIGEWIGIRPQLDHIVLFAHEAAGK